MAAEEPRQSAQSLESGSDGFSAETVFDTLVTRLVGVVDRHLTEWPRMYVNNRAALYEMAEDS